MLTMLDLASAFFAVASPFIAAFPLLFGRAPKKEKRIGVMAQEQLANMIDEQRKAFESGRLFTVAGLVLMMLGVLAQILKANG